MTNSKTTGVCLLTGAVLLVITMALHPSGGTVEHILRIKSIIIVSHSLAIVSLPVLAFGYWGITLRLDTEGRIAWLAFMIGLMGLIAAMIAATINGLTLPLFLAHFQERNADAATINAIIRYGTYINIPMDYILIASFAVSIQIWSVLIIKNAAFPKWLGWYGTVLTLSGVVAVSQDFSLTSLYGFRIVILGFVSWIAIAAVYLIRSSTTHGTTP